eukprot:6206138-Pleurochrysis_carterae.AAC.2
MVLLDLASRALGFLLLNQLCFSYLGLKNRPALKAEPLRRIEYSIRTRQLELCHFLLQRKYFRSRLCPAST